MSIVLTITDAGRAALVNAARDGTNAVRIAGAGLSPTAVAPSPSATTLPGEVKRIATISGGASAADVIHLIVRDETSDSYTVRSFGLYLGDGTLFAIYGQASPIIEKSSAALLLLAIDATLVDISATQITFGNANFLNPMATTDTPGVVELATLDEARAGVPNRVLTPALALAALLGLDGSGSGLDADFLDGLDSSAFMRASEGAKFALLTGGAFTGPVQAVTPGNGDSGGFRLLANDLSGFAKLQVLNRSGDAQWGVWTYSADGVASWSGPLRRGTAMLWDAANDGSGSGLDADLLDGLDSTAFMRASEGAKFALLTGGAFTGPVQGVTPGNGDSGGFRLLANDLSGFAKLQVLNRAGDVQWGAWTYSADGVASWSGPLRRGTAMLWDAANDGSGSGLDADLLDGLDSTAFMRASEGAKFALLTGGAFTGPVQGVTPGNGDSGGFRLLANDLSGFAKLQVLNRAGDVQWGAWTYSADGVASWSGPLRRGTAMLWDAANDGSGSGLDADLLDGLDSSAFMRASEGAKFALLTGGAFTGPVQGVTPGNGDSGGFRLLANDLSGFAKFQVLNRPGDAQWGAWTYSADGYAAWSGTLGRLGSGRYVHFADDLPGDTITRGTAPPSGGKDGDTHYQVDTDAGTMRLWHNYRGTWVHS
ncbi:hypothetical protein QE363_000748 [Sphingomonas sp. SORGH_AS870]|uniref:hypothetical protein n=1 Tax=Sphingomonas sp. SORGH_AS_0870 TaxID=3041801 RepID=UPI00285CCA7C|nr:hypothetical protein [Sphingomonas sp. SORGH_AS_0870]MDR6144955.1 hypothetical protein [Sphingomonas sp. SORGH_AS_0870]